MLKLYEVQEQHKTADIKVREVNTSVADIMRSGYCSEKERKKYNSSSNDSFLLRLPPYCTTTMKQSPNAAVNGVFNIFAWSENCLIGMLLIFISGMNTQLSNKCLHECAVYICTYMCICMYNWRFCCQSGMLSLSTHKWSKNIPHQSEKLKNVCIEKELSIQLQSIDSENMYDILTYDSV